ncbi:hypothetical protein N7367_09265 [Stenotrophomonas sp. GD04145]|uniref:phage integrase central domain-containing protein n=1 Tax=Stenotrophomonas TaxID=40323 RepID=UPI002402769F|nr:MULTISPECIES: hypothetical protein [Stenotrophomonas]MDH0171632.1 hypothetical protein [Stenotrophomonas sp. GD04145]
MPLTDTAICKAKPTGKPQKLRDGNGPYILLRPDVDKIILPLESDIFTSIGNLPVGAITAPELLKHLARIEQRGAIETAHRALETRGAVFRYAVRPRRADGDSTGALKGALTPWRPMPFAAATIPAAATALLRKIDSSTSRPIVRSALRLAPLLSALPANLSA